VLKASILLNHGKIGPRRELRSLAPEGAGCIGKNVENRVETYLTIQVGCAINTQVRVQIHWDKISPVKWLGRKFRTKPRCYPSTIRIHYSQVNNAGDARLGNLSDALNESAVKKQITVHDVSAVGIARPYSRISDQG
jgi:hypothetical protein